MNMEYHYRECGLDNVVIYGIGVQLDDHGKEILTIRNVGGLHKLIAQETLQQKRGLNAKEVRFLRTEMGMTQAELAEKLHKDHQTVGRWERGETAPIDPLADFAIRILAAEILDIKLDSPVTEVTGWCVHRATADQIIIDGTNPKRYRLKKAA